MNEKRKRGKTVRKARRLSVSLFAIVLLFINASLSASAAFAGNPGYIWAFDKSSRIAQAYRVRSLDTTIAPTAG